MHRTVKKNRPLCQQKRQKPRKKPRAVSSRVAPVSVGKDKNRKNPLRRMQMSLTSHGRCIRLKIPRASSGIFSRLHHPPYRVLHPAQGDKQKKTNLSSTTRSTSSVTTNPSSATRMSRSIHPFSSVVAQKSVLVRSIRGLFTPCMLLPKNGLFLFIALQRMDAFCKKVMAGFQFGR